MTESHYAEFIEDKDLIGTVVAVSEKRFLIQVLGEFIGALSKRSLVRYILPIEIGTELNVRCIKVNDTYDRFRFDLSENVTKRLLYNKKKEAFALLKVGDKYMGVINGATDYGVFVNIPAGSGLLHVKYLYDIKPKVISVEHKKIVGEKLPQIFMKGEPIEVIIKEIHKKKKRISFSWDGLSTINIAYNQMFNDLIIC